VRVGDGGTEIVEWPGLTVEVDEADTGLGVDSIFFSTSVSESDFSSSSLGFFFSFLLSFSGAVETKGVGQ